MAGFGVAAAAAARFLRRPAVPAPPVPPAPPREQSPPAEPAPPPEAASPTEPEPEAGDDPEVHAEALRRRIAESRALVEERDEFEDGETPVDQADPDVRRRAVHERGRDAVDRMRDPG